MAITTYAELEAALKNTTAQRCTISKSAIGNGVANMLASRWLSTPLPAGGSAPAAAAIPTRTTTGAMTFRGVNLINATAPAKNYLAQFDINQGLAAVSIADRGYALLADRVGHMGGLSATLLTLQTVSLDLTSLPAARLGATNYSEIEWFLEIYSDVGTTATNATINVTYNDASSEDIVISGVFTVARRSQSIIPIVPATQGKFIRSVNNVTLSASTGTAGNFGVTAYKRICNGISRWEQATTFNNFAQVGCPIIPDDACLTILIRQQSTNATAMYGQIVIVTA